MLFTSTNDNAQKIEEHLVVFCYDNRRLLLPLPKTYADGVQLVREEFLLPNNCEISFTTREIPGCGGESVEIHRRTWKAITPILAQITVNVAGAPAQGRMASEAPTVPDEMQVEGPTAGKGKGKAKENTPTREDRPAAVSKISKRPSMAAAGALLPNETNVRTSTSRLSASGVLPSGSHRVSIATPIFSPAACPASSGQNAASQETSNYDEDELEAEQLLRSPKKTNQRSARKRIISDDEQDFEEVQAPASQSSRDNRRSALASSPLTAKTPKQERIAPPNKRARTPPAATENNYSSTVASSTLGPADNIVDPWETCLITVDYDDGNEICSSTFKTKGRHTVHKVLMTVCKTFSIDNLYHRANLVRVISDSTDDPNFEDQVMEQRFVCPRDHTMTQVGAHDEARFAIEIHEDGSDSA